MIDMYPKAYKEVYIILQRVSEEDLNKIPNDVLETIENNMDNEYEFELTENEDFLEKNILKETKALLAVLYRDYWATEEEKNRIDKKIKNDIELLESKKKETYNPNMIFKNNLKEEKMETNLSMIEYRESIIKKILNKIKKFLKIGKK